MDAIRFVELHAALEIDVNTQQRDIPQLPLQCSVATYEDLEHVSNPFETVIRIICPKIWLNGHGAFVGDIVTSSLLSPH